MPNVIEMDDAKYREWGNSTYDVLYLKNWKNYFKEIFDNRDAIKSLVKKSFYGRYKSTHLGVIWQFITPLMILLMYVIFFEGGIRTENKDNMWLFLASAVFPFNFLRMNTIGGSVCFTGNANYIKKMYFPHSIFIYSHIINTFIVFVITLLGLFIAMAILGLSISIEIMPWLVVYILISIFFSIGSALLLSTINVLIRDTQYVLNAIGTSLFFITPILHTMDEAEGVLYLIMGLNPLSYFIEPFRDMLYYGAPPQIDYLLICVLITAIVLVSGILIYNFNRAKIVEMI